LKDVDSSVHKDVTEGQTDGRTDGRTNGSVTISLRNFVGEGIITILNIAFLNFIMIVNI
jgi:hypothetical protein